MQLVGHIAEFLMSLLHHMVSQCSVLSLYPEVLRFDCGSGCLSL